VRIWKGGTSYIYIQIETKNVSIFGNKNKRFWRHFAVAGEISQELCHFLIALILQPNFEQMFFPAFYRCSI
jgi:hypothetical protein